MAAAGERRAVPGWTGLSAVSSSVAPVCQRIPIRTLAWSGSGSTVTSAIRVRSGEFLQVVPAGQRRQRVLGNLQRLLGFSQGGKPGLPSRLQGAGDQPVLRLDLAERALCAVGRVAGTLDGELGRAADPLVPAGHLVGGGERERDLLGGQRVQQRTRDSIIDAGCHHGPARRRGQPVPA